MGDAVWGLGLSGLGEMDGWVGAWVRDDTCDFHAVTYVRGGVLHVQTGEGFSWFRGRPRTLFCVDLHLHHGPGEATSDSGSCLGRQANLTYLVYLFPHMRVSK